MHLNVVLQILKFAVHIKKIAMCKAITGYSEEEMLYSSPSIIILELCPEGMFCGSGTEDVEFLDGEW